MSLLLSILGTTLAFLGVVLVLLPMFLPRIGVSLIHRVVLKRGILFASAIILSGTVFLISSNLGELILLTITILFFIMGFIVRPWIIFRELDSTDHVHFHDADLDNDELILGYEEKGFSLAWPVEEMLMPRHVVNDELDGTPILATYCPVCRSGMLFKAELNGERLTFRVQGLWRRNLVMMDYQTKTLWQQATGEAIYGRLKGEKLVILDGQQMKWLAWKKKHPKTKLAIAPRNAKKGIFPEERLNRMFDSDRFSPPGLTHLGEEVRPKETVYGIAINGLSKAYRVSDLTKSDEIADRLDDQELRIRYNAETEEIEAFRIQEGMRVQISIERHRWLAWKEFHPDTELYAG
ncbi:MAG: DUF3179 domain-containing (seleno)protein [Candidatus Thorarchaeota archaeon]|jgi:hypothetical protein